MIKSYIYIITNVGMLFDNNKCIYYILKSNNNSNIHNWKYTDSLEIGALTYLVFTFVILQMTTYSKGLLNRHNLLIIRCI